MDTTDVFLSDQVPGFIGNAFEYTVNADFDSAEISFTFPEELLSDPDFEPAIFYFDEEDQLLILLEDQTISGNTVTARTPHFSKYTLLNKTEYEKVWTYTFKFDASAQSFQNVDVAFVIDSSGSMSWNDNSGIRKDVTMNFINELSTSDRAAVIDFDSSAKVYAEFTNDKDALEGAVKKIDSSGGTNLSTGIQEAIKLFTDASYTNQDALKLIVMLTDGDGSYDTKLTKTAKDNGIIIYTVGLGESVSVARLTGMAEGTGGQYYPASDAEKLYGIFKDIAEEADLKKDSDGDGINDYFEKEMSAGRLTLGSGVPLLGMDYQNADSDGDTLKDGKELSVERSRKDLGFIGNERIYVKLYSNPISVDTDGDGIDDPEDELPLYAFRYAFLGSPEHLNFVEERVSLQMQDVPSNADYATLVEGVQGTEILMKDYYEFLEYKGVDSTGKSREEYWKPEWDRYWDAYCDIINEYAAMRGSVDQELHYFRNNLNRIPKTLDDMMKKENCNKWTLLSVSDSAFHIFPTRFSGNGLHNLKFISNDGKYEAVYVNNYGNPYGNKPEPHYNGSAATDETDSTNMGTYNYGGDYVKNGLNLDTGAKHLFLDMIPYYTLGNTSPDDLDNDCFDYFGATNKRRYTDDNSDAAKAAQAARAKFLENWNGNGNE